MPTALVPSKLPIVAANLFCPESYRPWPPACFALKVTDRGPQRVLPSPTVAPGSWKAEGGRQEAVIGMCTMFGVDAGIMCLCLNLSLGLCPLRKKRGRFL